MHQTNGPTISNQPKVTIEGAPLPEQLAAALGECWVESGVNLPGAFHLTFNESAHLLMKKYQALLRIGAKVAVYAVADRKGETSPVITGVVTAIETEYENAVATTILRGLDHSFTMMRQRRATGYLNMTASEIVRKVAALDGVEIGTIESTSTLYPLTTQPNISDWQFVQYLAERSDMEADFDHAGRLRFRAPVRATAGTIELDFETDVLHCRAGVSASDQVSQVVSRGWNVDAKMPVLGRATAVSNPEYSIGTTPGRAATVFGAATLTETGTPYGTQAEADRAAKSLAADITSAFAEMEIGVRGWPDLLPGVVIRLKGAGEPFDGSYTVSATRHAFGRDNRYTTEVRVTGRQVRTLYGLAAGAQPEPRIPGVVNAIVTDINDPKQQGRVKLKFPWFDDTYVTDWARTVQFGGHRGGGVISPEVDDEVLVAFDRGSLDHPYVLGGLYSNPQNSPSKHDVPLHTGGRLNRRSLVSRTGHRLELVDAVRMKGVRLQTGDKNHIVFLDEGRTRIVISSKGTIDIKGDADVSVTSTAEVEVEAPTVRITGNVMVVGDMSVTGEVNIMGALTQEGAVNITGAMSVEGDVNIVGAETVSGEIEMDGMQVATVPV